MAHKHSRDREEIALKFGTFRAARKTKIKKKKQETHEVKSMCLAHLEGTWHASHVQVKFDIIMQVIANNVQRYKWMEMASTPCHLVLYMLNPVGQTVSKDMVSKHTYICLSEFDRSIFLAI